MNHPYDLDAAALDRGWRELRSDIEIDHAPVEHPTVVFLGAQPAAGKSHAQAEILRWYDRPMFTVDSDELRAHHPAFEEIMSTDPQRMPVLTNQAASEWTRRSIQYARQHRLDTIIENTFHNPTVIRDSAADFRAAGHRVHAVAVAVPAEVSRLAMADRYLTSLEAGRVPRWTTLAAHDQAVTGASDTLSELHHTRAVDRLTIIDRHGHRAYDAHTDTPEWSTDPANALTDARKAHWSPATREDHARLYRHVAAAALRTDSVTDTTRAVFAALADDAERVAGNHIAHEPTHHRLREAVTTTRSLPVGELLHRTRTPFTTRDPFTTSTPTPEPPHIPPAVEPNHRADPELGL